MNALSRKLTIQLTPLLDLMLIVIFAQYIDMRETNSARERQRAEQAGAQRAELEVQRRLALAQLARDRDEFARRQAEFDKRRDETAQREDDLRESLQRALEEQKQTGDIVAELFRVPDKLIDELLQPSERDPAGRSEKEVESLKGAFRELAKLRGTEAVKHLLTYEELRKRCDIWDVYISEEGVVTFDAGTITKRFRFREADADTPGARTRAQIRAEDEHAAGTFADRVFDLYKTLPQTKSVVIMLLSYSKTTSYNWRRPALLGLATAADRMRADSSGHTRFEYAVIGPVDAPAARPSPQ